MAYLLLAASGLALFAYSMWRSECRARLLALFAVAAAGIMLADWVAYGWFHLYSYRTGLPLPKRPDDALGEFLADIVFVPAATSFLVSNVNTYIVGIIVGSAVYAGLQIWFTEWGLLIERGWSAWHTAAAFPFYFGFLYWYWHRLDEVNLTTGWQGKLLRFCMQFNMIALLTLALRAGQLVETELHIMPTHIGNQSLGRFLTYVLVPVPLGYWVAGKRGRARWLGLGAIFAFVLAADWVMGMTGFQHFHAPWSALLDAIAHTVAISVGIMACDGIRRLARSENGWRPPVLPRGNRTR